MTDLITINESAEHPDMREATIRRLIGDGVLTGYVDWGEVEAKVPPVRQPSRGEKEVRAECPTTLRSLCPR